MKVLLLGPNGQLGHDIRHAHEAADTPFHLVPIGRDQLDVAESGSVELVLGEYDFDVLINCTGYHKTDEVEDNASLAFAVNAHAVQAMAQTCCAKRARFIHVSTDYVFGGDITCSTPLLEHQAIAPVNVYGASKALGETLARLSCKDTIILRVASLFGVAGASSKGGNFIETMIRVGREKGALKVVDDQIMSPTATADIAEVILLILKDGCEPSIYHAVNSGSASWFEFAREIIRRTAIEATVTPCASSDYSTRAMRPRYSVLNNSKLQAALGPMPSWQDALDRYLHAKGHVAGQPQEHSEPPAGSTALVMGEQKLPFSLRYMLMTTDQVPPNRIDEWLRDPIFAAYVGEQRR